MKTVEFFSLSRPIQERFIAAARAQGAPIPILVARVPPPMKVIGWAAAAVAFVIVWILFLQIGYGDLSSSLAIAGVWTIGIQIALLVGAFLCGLRAKKAREERRRLPFLPTMYLFPIGVIDARTTKFVVHPLSDMAQVDPGSSGVKFRFKSGFTFEFPLPADRRNEALELVEVNRKKLATLMAEGRDTELAGPSSLRGEDSLVAMDPLLDNGFRNPLSPLDSLHAPSNQRWYLEPVAALAVATVVAGFVFLVRNKLSESKLYATARELDSTAAYRDYLARGGSKSDVGEVLLPRAELREAAKKNSVEAIEEFMTKNPDSKIGAEIQAALKTALLRNLEQAEQAGTLTSLADFQTKYARHGLVDRELSEARVKYLGGVLKEFEQKSTGDPEQIDFVRRLINWGAKKGPKAVVRFRRRMPGTLEDAQKLIIKSNYFAGDATLPSKFFGVEQFREREERYGKEIVERLQQALPPELVHFELDKTIEDGDDKQLPEVEVPTLLITYRHELSGAFMSRRPRAVFAGVGMFTKMHFILPGDDKPLAFEHKNWLAPDVRRIEAGELETTKVYEDMTDKSFKKLMKKYFATWFKEAPAAAATGAAPAPASDTPAATASGAP